MDLRTRCEFLPLATQQLRLRNLVRIQGFNIEVSLGDEALVYYTLHSNRESASFYKSETQPRRNMQQKWAEISCAEMRKSNANCVCVKVWLQVDKTENKEPLAVANHMQEVQCREPISALSKEMSNACLSPNSQPRPPDKLLFQWGVYFSGLVLMSQPAEMECQPNSLVFQMNENLFASPEHFTVDTLREQISQTYQRFSASVPKTISNSLPQKFCINSPQGSRSSSPSANDWQGDLLHMSKTRYMQLNCARRSVRKSYDLEKLLQIQQLQRLQLQKKRESEEIAAEIKHKCMHCITKDQVLRKPRSTSRSSSAFLQQHHSMGRTLSVLLAEERQVSPHVLLRAQELQKQLETMRSRKRLLKAERETYTARIIQLRQRQEQITHARQQLRTWLMEKYDQLIENEQKLESHFQELLAQTQTKRLVAQNVERRMSSLCMELREIYPISRNTQGYTICGIPFPPIEAYVGEVCDMKYVSGVSLENTPMALSAALGYIAHLVQMISVIINRPLRNPIVCEGSRTRIKDIVKDIPYASREFPLYSRSNIPSKPVKYAIHLLNQNIAQLCYDITGIRCYHRATVANILQIFISLGAVEENQREIHSRGTHTHPNNRLKLRGDDSTDDIDSLSKSHSSVDIKLPHISSLLQMPSSQPIPIAEHICDSPQQRVCRSVGSYSDCEENFTHINEHCYSNSDSNIVFQSNTHA